MVLKLWFTRYDNVKSSQNTNAKNIHNTLIIVKGTCFTYFGKPVNKSVFGNSFNDNWYKSMTSSQIIFFTFSP